MLTQKSLPPLYRDIQRGRILCAVLLPTTCHRQATCKCNTLSHLLRRTEKTPELPYLPPLSFLMSGVCRLYYYNRYVESCQVVEINRLTQRLLCDIIQVYNPDKLHFYTKSLPPLYRYIQRGQILCAVLLLYSVKFSKTYGKFRENRTRKLYFTKKIKKI